MMTFSTALRAAMLLCSVASASSTPALVDYRNMDSLSSALAVPLGIRPALLARAKLVRDDGDSSAVVLPWDIANLFQQKYISFVEQYKKGMNNESLECKSDDECTALPLPDGSKFERKCVQVPDNATAPTHPNVTGLCIPKAQGGLCFDKEGTNCSYLVDILGGKLESHGCSGRLFGPSDSTGFWEGTDDSGDDKGETLCVNDADLPGWDPTYRTKLKALNVSNYGDTGGGVNLLNLTVTVLPSPSCIERYPELASYCKFESPMVNIYGGHCHGVNVSTESICNLDSGNNGETVARALVKSKLLQLNN